MAPVTGKITVSGQPVTKGFVIFMPDEAKGTSGKAAVGDIGPDGTYALRTFKANDGAIVGHHRVVISGQAIEDDEAISPDQQIPPRYGNPQQSGLTAEVTPAAEPINFDLKP